MIALRYTIELLEPALLTGLDGEPNSAVSLDFLPGSTLRGAVIRALLSSNKNADVLPFLDGGIRFLNGYPTQDGNRALPLPLSLRREKYTDKPNTAYDQAVRPLPKSTSRSSPQWKNVGGGFAFLAESAVGKATQAEVHRLVTIHTTRDRRAGRATADEGTVFRYNALAHGQVFEAIVLCDSREQAGLVAPLLPQISRLGGSTRGGYGAVAVSPIYSGEEDDEEDPAIPFRESPMVGATALQKQIVLLLSDTILRDENGQTAVSPAVFERALGLPGNLSANKNRDADLAFLDAVTVGGFNRKWGLPLPQEQAFRRGSVLVLPPGTLSPPQIASLEADGIGERRDEGFGRLTVTASCAVWTIEEASDSSDEPTNADLKGMPEEEMAERISRRIQARRMEGSLRIRVSETRFVRGELKSSQVGRLRELLRQELLNEEPDPNCIETFVKALRPTAKRQFAAATVEAQSLLDWLSEQAKREFPVPATPQIGGVVAADPEARALKTRTQLQYVDAVLARMAKQKETE